jgi:hypothetical protein
VYSNSKFTVKMVAQTASFHWHSYRSQHVTTKYMCDLLVEFGATLSVEVTIISHRLPTDVAHACATSACHFVAASFFDKIPFALPARPTAK